MVQERLHPELTANGVVLERVDDDGGADPGGVDLVDDAASTERLPPVSTQSSTSRTWSAEVMRSRLTPSVRFLSR